MICMYICGERDIYLLGGDLFIIDFFSGQNVINTVSILNVIIIIPLSQINEIRFIY